MVNPGVVEVPHHARNALAASVRCKIRGHRCRNRGGRFVVFREPRDGSNYRLK
jgi:hypothetical protein